MYIGAITRTVTFSEGFLVFGAVVCALQMIYTSQHLHKVANVIITVEENETHITSKCPPEVPQ